MSISGVVSSKFDLMVPHGKLDECIADLEEGLRAIRKTPYHHVLGRDFLHKTKAAGDFLIEFHRKASSKIKLAAIYFEMNGFTINTDLWWYSGFAFKTAGDLWDLDWLAEWDAETETA